MTIHASDPFADPDPLRSPVRRLRGRLASTVTLWTAIGPDGRPTGLTVSSTMIIDGEPPLVIGLIDRESTTYEAIQATGRFTVSILGPDDRRVADRFAGLFPAPGGPFTVGDWTPTEFGPVPAHTAGWAAAELLTAEAAGWGDLVKARLVEVSLGPPGPPLLHYRGGYHRLAD